MIAVFQIGIAVGIAWLGGVFLTRSLWREHWILSAALGLGVGLGVASGIYFVWRISGLPDWELVLWDALLLVISGIAYQVVQKRSTPPAELPPRRAPLWLMGALALVLIADVFSFIGFTVTNPYGDWDAWAIWNLRARFLYSGGNAWTDGFSNIIGWSHPDYPVLIPSLVARGWLYTRYEAQFVPALIAFMFTFGTVALLIGGLRSRSLPIQCALAR